MPAEFHPPGTSRRKNHQCCTHQTALKKRPEPYARGRPRPVRYCTGPLEIKTRVWSRLSLERPLLHINDMRKLFFALILLGAATASLAQLKDLKPGFNLFS